MNPNGERQPCRRCGAKLAADNRSDVCGPCTRSAADARTEPPELPGEFWDRSEIRTALAERHFGHLLLAYRLAHTPTLKQSDLGNWLGLSQVQISRIERGKSLTRDLEKLDRWARTLKIPEEHLWFRLSPQPHDVYLAEHCRPNLRGNPDPEGDDVERRRFLRTVGAGVGASLISGTWRRGEANATPVRIVGNPDVDLVRETTAAFRRVDNRYGGGHSRSAVDTFIRTTVEPKLSDGRGRTATRRDLFAASAELHQLAGWMAYDTGQAGAGRRHLRTALRLCQEVEDHALGAEMLNGMSHQASFHGSPEDAVDLALAARQSARPTGLAVLQAEAAVMEAHGLALQRDEHGCVAALSQAEKLFESADQSNSPEWLGYFDRAYLSAKFAHSFRDLGRPAEAESFARSSLEMSDGYERGRLFNTALLASILSDLGQIDEACACGEAALRMIETVRSVRSAAYLADCARRMERHRTYPAVLSLYQKMVAAGIPVPDRA